MKPYFKPITHFLALTFAFGFLFQVQLSAQVTYAKAIKKGNLGCRTGSFSDPIDGGTCWSCPKGYKRTVFSVKGDKACERSAMIVYKKAIDKGKGTGILRTDCPKGAFFDPNGRCYTCPSGYKRTVYSVKGSKACSKRIPTSRVRARLVGNKVKKCGKNSFFDPIDLGSCWSCPEGYKRTIYPVDGDKACKKSAGD